MATPQSPSIKDFSRQEYNNTMFPTRRKAKGIIIAFFVVFLLLGGAALFLLTPWLNIHDYQISGLQYVSEVDVVNVIDATLEQKIQRVISGRHRYFMSLENLRAALQSRFDFERLSIAMNGPSLDIRVKERPTGVLLITSDRHVFADLDGKLSRDATNEEVRLVSILDKEPPFLVLSSETSIVEPFGATIFNAKFLESFQSLKLRFEVETGLKVTRYVLPRLRANWIKLMLSDKREVYIDTERDVEPQIRKLMTLLKEKGTEVATVSYIDLRFPDRVYFK